MKLNVILSVLATIIKKSSVIVTTPAIRIDLGIFFIQQTGHIVE
ncbi:MAG: hypothetical protein ABS939_01880 [Psychrobacillus sp.]